MQHMSAVEWDIACYAGYDGGTAVTWAKEVHRWGDCLSGHKHYEPYIAAVQAMSSMLKEALSKQPDPDAYRRAAHKYHYIMLTQFPKVTLRIYDHALLVHVPDLLAQGTLLDGSSWFLEAFNKVWKNQLLFHTNRGGGRKTAAQKENAGLAKQSAAGRERYNAEKNNKADRQALTTLWIATLPQYRSAAAAWRKSGVQTFAG
jgi:hypothetical protein